MHFYRPQGPHREQARSHMISARHIGASLLARAVSRSRSFSCLVGQQFALPCQPHNNMEFEFMHKRPLKKLLGAVVAAIGLSASLTASAADPLKVGFVYIGPIGDHGWTYQHEQGRKALAE